jgi:hypothetical protein
LAAATTDRPREGSFRGAGRFVAFPGAGAGRLTALAGGLAFPGVPFACGRALACVFAAGFFLTGREGCVRRCFGMFSVQRSGGAQGYGERLAALT